MIEIILHTDGGSRGNPGPAAIGALIERRDDSTAERQLLAELSQTIGVATNNTAEYEALVAGLSWVKGYLSAITALESSESKPQSQRPGKIICFLDSELVVRQVNGVYKTKQPSTAAYVARVHALCAEIGVPVRFEHVLRVQNKRADMLVNKALDAQP